MNGKEISKNDIQTDNSNFMTIYKLKIANKSTARIY